MNTLLKLAPNSVVLQPGDPINSPDGNTIIQVNNDGTVSITRPVTGGGTETRVLGATNTYNMTCTFSSGFEAVSTSPFKLECLLGNRIGRLTGTLKFTTARSAGYAADVFTFTLPSGAPTINTANGTDGSRRMLVTLAGSKLTVRLMRDVSANDTMAFFTLCTLS